MKELGLILAMMLALAACGGGDESELLGIYELDSWTENDVDSESEGASILSTSGSTHFYFKQTDFFGVNVLTLGHCVDVEECRIEGADQDGLDIGFAFTSGSDSAGWSGTISVGSRVPGTDTCDAIVRTHLLEEDGVDRLLVSTEDRSASGVPLDDEGFCDLDAAVELVQGQPCEALEVFAGTRIEPL